MLVLSIAAALTDLLTTPLRAQTDKKNLGAKAMLAEIKEIGEKRRAGEAASLAVVFSSSAPFGSRLHADLTFNYSDRRAPCQG